MTFKYQNFLQSFVYENIEPLAQIKLAWTYDYENSPIIANYQGKVEYFYAQQVQSDDQNFNVKQYILSLPIINIHNINECREIIDICSNRRQGSLEFYYANKSFVQEYLSLLPTTTSTTTTTITTTTVTTTPCPVGVPSRVYYIDITNICAICVATNEFVCNPYENYNYDNCLNSANSINQGNTNCTTTTLAPTSTTTIGPQG